MSKRLLVVLLAAGSILLASGCRNEPTNTTANANKLVNSVADQYLLRVGIATQIENKEQAVAHGLKAFEPQVFTSNLTDGTPIPAFPGPGGTPLQ